MSAVNVVILIVAIVAIAVAAWALMERTRTRNLKRQFGPEYDRTLDLEGNARRAAAVLSERQKRVEKYPIRHLTREECDHFAARWKRVQERFVDDPRDAVAQADVMITEAMRTRGYPMMDFDQRADDLSVDHPALVQEYRVAHDIAARAAQGAASTEDLRRAMQSYRALFEQVLDTRVLQHH